MNLHIISTSASLKMGHGKEYIENIVNRIYKFNKKDEKFDKINLYTFNLNSDINLNKNVKIIETDSKISKNNKDYYHNKYNKYLWRFFYGINRILNYNKLYDLFLKRYNKGDIVYFIEYEYISMFIKRKILKKNIVLTLHTMDFGKNEYSLAESIYKKISFLVNKNIFKYAKNILVHGEFIKKSFIDCYPNFSNKVKVVNYGIKENNSTDLSITECSKLVSEKYNYSYDNKKTNLLIFGMLRQNKGIIKFLNNFIKLPFNNNFNLLIVGKNYDLNENKINEIVNSQGNINWINNYIPDKDIKYFFNLSDYLILPYLKNMNSQSGPLKLAMGYNLPVITSKYGELGFFTKNYSVGEVFDPYVFESIKKVFLNLENTNYKYLNNIKKIKSKMSWNIMAKDIWDILKD